MRALQRGFSRVPEEHKGVVVSLENWRNFWRQLLLCPGCQSGPKLDLGERVGKL
jgi:hypothetical protein